MSCNEGLCWLCIICLYINIIFIRSCVIICYVIYISCNIAWKNGLSLQFHLRLLLPQWLDENLKKKNDIDFSGNIPPYFP